MSGFNLLRSCKPYDDENILSYFIRLSETNGYTTPSWIVGKVQENPYLVSRSALFGKLDFHLLSSMTRVPESTLVNMVYFPLTDSEGVKNLFCGRPIPRYLIRENPKVCPQCLQERPYAKKVWDLSFYTACPKHSISLLSSCPRCGTSLSWIRKSICHCTCGFDLRKVQPRPVSTSETAISHHIDHFINTKSMETRDFFRLPLEDFLSLISFFAGQYLKLNTSTGKLFANLPQDHLHYLLKDAYQIFENWPNNFYLFLDKNKGSLFTNVLYKTGLKKEFGSFYTTLYREFNSPNFCFLRYAFESYITSLWKGGYISDKSRIVTRKGKKHSKYASKTEAANFLKVVIDKIDKYIQMGYLSAEVLSMGKRTMYRVDRDSLIDLKGDFEKSLSLDQAASFLGIDRHQVSEMLNKNILQAFVGPTVDGSPIWRIKRISVDNLFSQLIEKSVDRLEIVEFITFHKAVQMMSIIKIDTIKLIELILSGEIVPRKFVKGFGLDGFFFDEYDIKKFIETSLENQQGGDLYLEEAAKVLNVKQEVLLFWLKKGLFSQTTRSDKYPRWWKISPVAIEFFKETYVLSAPLARSYGTSPRYFAHMCMKQGIMPVSGPEVDGGRQYLFRRDELKKVIANKVS